MQFIVCRMVTAGPHVLKKACVIIEVTGELVRTASSSLAFK
jgi:hypothetical protein